MKVSAKYALIGSAVGAVNGLFGAGGGMLAVPLLIRWAGLDSQKALATSLGIVLPLSAVSLMIYALRGGVSLTVAWPYVLGGVIGGAVAGLSFRKLPVLWLRRLFGALLLYGGVRAVLLL